MALNPGRLGGKLTNIRLSFGTPEISSSAIRSLLEVEVPKRANEARHVVAAEERSQVKRVWPTCDYRAKLFRSGHR
jgi:hypothetical protein